MTDKFLVKDTGKFAIRNNNFQVGNECECCVYDPCPGSTTGDLLDDFDPPFRNNGLGNGSHQIDELAAYVTYEGWSDPSGQQWRTAGKMRPLANLTIATLWPPTKYIAGSTRYEDHFVYSFDMVKNDYEFTVDAYIPTGCTPIANGASPPGFSTSAGPMLAFYMNGLATMNQSAIVLQWLKNIDNVWELWRRVSYPTAINTWTNNDAVITPATSHELKIRLELDGSRTSTFVNVRTKLYIDGALLATSYSASIAKALLSPRCRGDYICSLRGWTRGNTWAAANIVPSQITSQIHNSDISNDVYFKDLFIDEIPA
jgi:hypothetical protein